MCRAGGRRCPHQSSPEYKKRAAERRKKNRKAKKNLVHYFEEKGMDNTAKKLNGIRPSQIPAFLKAVGLDEKVLGTDIPGSNAGLKDTEVEASQFVDIALKEMNKKEISNNNDSVSKSAESIDENSVENYKKELVQNMAEKIYDIYQDDSVYYYDKEKQVYDYIDTLVENVDKFGTGDEYWKSVEKGINDIITERELGKPYIEAVDTYISNVEKIQNSDDYPKLINNLDSFPDANTIDDKLIEEYRQYKKENQYSFYYDQLGYALSSGKDFEILNHKDLGNGIYFIQIRGIISDYDNSLGPHYIMYKINENEKDLERRFRTVPIRNFYVGEIPASLGLEGIDEEEKKQITERYDLSYYVNDLTSRGRTKEAMKELLMRTKTQTVNYKQIRGLAVAKNIESGETFLQKKFSNIPIKHVGNTVSKRSSYFQAGVSLVEETNIEASKKIAKKAAIKTNIKKLLGEHDKNNTPTKSAIKDERIDAEIALQSLNSDDRNRVLNYTDTDYSNYSSRSYGTYRRFSTVTDEDVEKLNDVIKKVSKASVKKERFLYRSLKCPSGLSAKQYADSLQVGDVTITNKLTSTSIKHSVTQGFGNSGVNNSETVQFVYHTKKGAFVNSVSMHNTEEEVIIPIGEKMVVVDKIKSADGTETIIFGDAD